jgi:hypothetical protein
MGERRIDNAGSWNELQEQSRFLDGDRLYGDPGQMCGGRANPALDRLVEMTEMVGRMLRRPEHEQQKGQDERQRFDVLYARPFHCQHSPTRALTAAWPSACRAPMDGSRYADVV